MPENEPRPIVGNLSDEAVQAFLDLSAEVQQDFICFLQHLSSPE